MAVTAQFIDDNFNLKSVLLDCSALFGSHTSSNLAERLRQCASEWGLSDKVELVVSDNAANITSAVTKELRLKHFGCYAHSLNLVVQSAMKDPEFDMILTKVKDIVTFFKSSNLAYERLIKYVYA